MLRWAPSRAGYQMMAETRDLIPRLLYSHVSGAGGAPRGWEWSLGQQGHSSRGLSCRGASAPPPPPPPVLQIITFFVKLAWHSIGMKYGELPQAWCGRHAGAAAPL
jgi:hypothetical protein